MPVTPSTRCSEPGCTDLVHHGRCAKHARKPWGGAKAWQRIPRYQWEKARKRQLRLFPWCARCGQRATQVNHIVPIANGGAVFDEDNWESVCEPCHGILTRQQNAALDFP